MMFHQEVPFLNIFKQQPRTFSKLVKQYNQELCQIHDVSPRGVSRDH